MLAHLIDNRLITLHGLLVFAGLAIYVIGSRARGQRRHPSAAIAWVVSLALMPYVALPLYLLFGNRKVVRSHLPVAPAAAACEGGPAPLPAASFLPLARAMGLPEPAAYRELAVHQDGQQALQVIRAMLQQARRSLDLSTFLVGADVFGHELTGMLVQRARDGVRVRLLIDGVGVLLGGRIDIRGLRAAGVQVALFVSPLRSMLPGRTNLRNHRKLVIADGIRAWTGGRNLAAEYFVGDPSRKRLATPWVDLSFDLTGALAQQMQQRFEWDWCFATGAPAPQPSVAEPAAAAADPEADLAQLVASGPDQRDDTLYVLLVSACFTARSRILAITPYFVPDAVLLMSLTLAARRHVAVDLVLPRHSNHRLADLARHAALRELTAAGGRVWLVPAMVHAKAVVVDDDLAMAGSANLDERSLFLNYELMVAFRAPADVVRFSAWIDRHRSTAEPYRGDRPGVLREMVEGLVRWLAFQL